MTLTGLDGRVALVTGASRGIGKGIARVLAGNGCRVVCGARTLEPLVEACAEIERSGGIALPVQADVTSPFDRKRLIETALSRFHRVDFLINNAGVHEEKEALDLSDEELRQGMEVNFLSMFSLARDVARHMVQRGGGKIVNMGSF